MALTNRSGVRIPEAPLDTEVGGTGNVLQSGRFTEEEFNKALRPFKARGLQSDHGIFDRMRRTDATVNGVLLSQELPIRAAEWMVEPPENPTDQERLIADEVAENLFTRIEGGWDGFLSQAMLFLQFGFMLFERVYRRTPRGYHQLRKLAPRMPWSVWKWVEDDNGNLIGVTQRVKRPNGGTYDNVIIPAHKTLLLINRLEGANWEGISAIRQAYGPWLKKDEIDRRDLINYERFGSGLPVFEEPPNFNPSDPQWKADLDRVAEIGRNLRAHEKSYVQVPRGWTFDIKFPQGAGLPVNEKQKYYDHQILLNSLAMLMDLGNTETGSRALGETFADLFLHSLRGHARVVEDALNGVNGLPFTGVIPEMVNLNFGRQGRYPKIRATKLSSKAINVQLSSMSEAVKSGLLSWGGRDEELLRDWLDLPSTPHEIETATPDTMATPNSEVLQKPEPSLNKASKCGSDKASKGGSVKFSDIDGREFSTWRAPVTMGERVVRWAEIDENLDKSRLELGELLDPIIQNAVREYKENAAPLINAIRIDPENSDLTNELSSLRLGYDKEIVDAVQEHMSRITEFSRDMVLEEIKRQSINASTKDGETIRLQAETEDEISALIDEIIQAEYVEAEALVAYRAMAAASAARAVQGRVLGTLSSMASADATTGSTFISEYNPPKASGTIYRAAADSYQQSLFSLAREEAVESIENAGGPPISTVRYTAILDRRTCMPCSGNDGNVYTVGSGDYDANKPPFVACDGMNLCRCMYIYELGTGPVSPTGIGELG